MPGLLIKSLVTTDIDKAYPLVRSTLSGLSLSQWQNFANTLLDHPAGLSDILTASTSANHIRGLLAFRIEMKPEGPTFNILLFCLPGFRSTPISRPLLAAAHAISRHFNCTNVTIALPHGTPAPAGIAALGKVRIVQLSLQRLIA